VKFENIADDRKSQSHGVVPAIFLYAVELRGNELQFARCDADPLIDDFDGFVGEFEGDHPLGIFDGIIDKVRNDEVDHGSIGNDFFGMPFIEDGAKRIFSLERGGDVTTKDIKIKLRGFDGEVIVFEFDREGEAIEHGTDFEGIGVYFS